jgi:hypothetical protein
MNCAPKVAASSTKRTPGKSKTVPMKFLAALILLPALGQAATVFDGYEAYYETLPNRLFRDKGTELQTYSLEGDDVARHEWHGMAAGRQQRIDVRDGQLKINGRVLSPKRVRAFPDEVVSNSDLGLGTTVYFSTGWVCVENTPASASGTAVRHKVVYLIKQSGKQQQGWKLPSLFASCTAIRIQKGQVQFDKVTYRYLDGQDEPQGVMFKGYAIQGNKFVATGGERTSTFLEAGNVYKFSIESN